MKILLYMVAPFLFILNVSAERVMLAEGEIIVLDTTMAQSMPGNTSEAIPAEIQGDNTASVNSDVNQTSTMETAQEEQSGISQGSVTRSIFTSEVSEHEPIDKIEKLESNNRSVYYFTELRDMSGQTAIHRWEFKGKIMAETKFTVDGPRWRVWSSKNLLPTWTGEWKVSVLNGIGDVISEDIFSYIEEVERLKTTLQRGNEPSIEKTTSEPDQSYYNDKLNP